MIPYLLHTAILTALLYLAYLLLLKKETFFQLNRVVLTFSILIAFMLPLIPIPAAWSWRGEAPQIQAVLPLVETRVELSENEVAPTREVASTPLPPENQESTLPSLDKPAQGFSLWSILLFTYWIGVFIMAINLLIQLAAIFYQMFAKPSLKDGHFRLVELDNDKAPFSFANSIFINPSKYDWDTYNQILEHEKTHIEQGHSFDILLAELLVVVQWFNPFAWMLRKTVEDNLEYLTDERMLAKGIDKESYQLNLLKVAVPYHPLSPSNNYNQSTLKSRITMMNIKKSSLSSSWKYLCVLSLFGLSTVFFNPTQAANKTSEQSPDIDLAISTTSRSEFPNKGIWSAAIEGDEICIKFDVSQPKQGHWWVSTKCYPSSTFANLPMGTEGSFTLKREAGTITFNGKFEAKEGLGRFTFAPDEDFRAMIKKEGYDKVSDEVLFGFTLSNIDRNYWAYLKQEGLTPRDEEDLEDISHHLPPLPTLKQNIEGYKQLGFNQLKLPQLVDLSIHDVSPDFIKSIQQLGFKNMELEEYEDAKIHGINAAYIAEMKALGFNNLSFEEVVNLKIHGVNKAFVEDLKKAGYTNLNAEDVTDAKIHDISTQFAAEMKALGFKDLTLEELEELKMHGVNQAYVADLQKAGYTNLSAEEITDAKIHGVSAQFATEMKALGFKDLTLEGLEELKMHGVNQAYVADLQKAGYTNLSAEEITDAKIHGVSAQFATEMKALGFKDLSLEDLEELKIHGISKAYVEELKQAGYTNLSAEEITDAKIHGVSTKFVKEMVDMGYKDASLDEIMEAAMHGISATYAKELKAEGLNDLSLETLVEMKIQGVTPAFIRKVKGMGMDNLSASDYVELKIMGLEDKIGRKKEE
ncbi:MAG: M56 family metallopeptidase [Saprospiraceae bacterium]